MVKLTPNGSWINQKTHLRTNGFKENSKINLKGDPSQYQPAPATPTTEAANSQSGAPQFFNPTQFGANPPAMPTS